MRAHENATQIRQAHEARRRYEEAKVDAQAATEMALATIAARASRDFEIERDDEGRLIDIRTEPSRAVKLGEAVLEALTPPDHS